MNKKASLAWEKIAVVIILLITLIIVLVGVFAPEVGLFSWIIAWTQDAEGLIPGTENIETQALASSPELDDFFTEFTTLLRSASNENERCIITYEKLDDFNGFSVDLFNQAEHLVVRKINNVDQVVDQKVVDNLNFCLVNPQPFYNNYLDGSVCEDSCEQDYITQSSARFTEDEINGEWDLDDGGILYKPAPGLVCLIPTHAGGIGTLFRGAWGCDPTENTLDDDCIEAIQQIPSCEGGN